MTTALSDHATAIGPALIEARALTKSFGRVVAIEDVSITVRAGEVVCLLGADGAGKTTLLKALSGVHRPDSGRILVDGAPVRLRSPRDALRRGFATAYQDVLMCPSMSVARNFVLGNEPTLGLGPLRRYDAQAAHRICRDELLTMGIDLGDTSRAAGTLSGPERRAFAIARAVHFGARAVFLDEPTSGLGVADAVRVLRSVVAAQARGLGIVLSTRDVSHAFPVGDRFVVLDRGRMVGTYQKAELSRDELLRLMRGGDELDRLSLELEEYSAEIGHGESRPNGPPPSADPPPPTSGVAI